MHGLLSPFIELGVGFNTELTARDNIRINGTLLGLSKQELAERFDAIVAFAGLERFIDQKLKNFSSGMQVRLAYSIAIQVDFDVLLLDEVLAVGDEQFQEKCFESFEEMRAAARRRVRQPRPRDAGSVLRARDAHRARKQIMLGPTPEVIDCYRSRAATATVGPDLVPKPPAHV